MTASWASEESFKILAGGTELYTSPSLVNNAERVLEICLANSIHDGLGIVSLDLDAAVQLAVFVVHIDDGLQVADTDTAGDGQGSVYISGELAFQGSMPCRR